MGRSTTPTYRVEYVANNCVITPGAWHTRNPYDGDGKPTAANLEKHVYGLEESVRSGVNSHLGSFFILRARIVQQRTNKVVAEWTRPLFSVVA